MFRVVYHFLRYMLRVVYPLVYLVSIDVEEPVYALFAVSQEVLDVGEGQHVRGFRRSTPLDRRLEGQVVGEESTVYRNVVPETKIQAIFVHPVPKGHADEHRGGLFSIEHLLRYVPLGKLEFLAFLGPAIVFRLALLGEREVGEVDYLSSRVRPYLLTGGILLPGTLDVDVAGTEFAVLVDLFWKHGDFAPLYSVEKP